MVPELGAITAATGGATGAGGRGGAATATGVLTGARPSTGGATGCTCGRATTGAPGRMPPMGVPGARFATSRVPKAVALRCGLPDWAKARCGAVREASEPRVQSAGLTWRCGSRSCRRDHGSPGQRPLLRLGWRLEGLLLRWAPRVRRLQGGPLLRLPEALRRGERAERSAGCWRSPVPACAPGWRGGRHRAWTRLERSNFGS